MSHKCGNERVYRSIFLEDDWAMQKYFGWSVVSDEPGLRRLCKERPLVRRTLLLLTKGGRAALGDAVRSAVSHPVADVTIHDFDDELAECGQTISGRRFQPINGSERLLNIATYVIDLNTSQDKLWENLQSKRRNSIRKIERQGYSFLHDPDPVAYSQHFTRLYVPIAKRNDLIIPDERLIVAMHERGNAIITACCDGDGKVVIVNVHYTAGNKAYYMYGATDAAIGTGVGQFHQWHNILLLKASGFEWYDLGGVRDPEIFDGVHAFKKSVGGTLCRLGKELYFGSSAFVVARKLFHRSNTSESPQNIEN